MAHRLFPASLQLISILAACACKAPATQVVSGSDQDLPKLVGAGQGDAMANQRIGRLVVGTGLGLSIDLARPPPPGSANLLACWSVPPVTFVLGRAICASDPQRSVEITAVNVAFSCSVNSEFAGVPAKQSLALEGCGEFDVYSYKFDPPLEMEFINWSI